jgi:glycosyltransferase involved in cell wall biosynthesis
LNSPEDHYESNKQKYRKEPTFKVVYGGHIMRDRSIENICSAIKDLINVKFYMHGLLIDKKLLDEVSTQPNVKYKGYLTNTDEYYKSIMMADVMIAVYSPVNPSYSITMHNKTYEAMMCGIPIITNLSTNLVRDLGFGVIVDYGNVEQIRSAIVSLRDNRNLCERLGKNGRKAYLEKYNWKVAEKEIYRICDNLLNNS